MVPAGRKDDAPFRPDNVGLGRSTLARLAEINARWSPDYGSAPIPVPESDQLYTTRAAKAGASLRARFPSTMAGNVAIFTHATTSFSVAYGLCFGPNGTDAALQVIIC